MDKNLYFCAVSKQRHCAGSYNVKLSKTRSEAIHLIKIAFRAGFRQFDPVVSFKEQILKYRKGESSIKNLVKAVSHIVLPYKIEKSKGKERGYVYFQEFILDYKYDIRVQLVGLKGYAMIRYVRKNDFRASGGGNIGYVGTLATNSPCANYAYFSW